MMEIIWREQRGATCHVFDGSEPDALSADGHAQRTVWTAQERPGVMVVIEHATPNATDVGWEYFTQPVQTVMPGVEIGAVTWQG